MRWLHLVVGFNACDVHDVLTTDNYPMAALTSPHGITFRPKTSWIWRLFVLYSDLNLLFWLQLILNQNFLQIFDSIFALFRQP